MKSEELLRQLSSVDDKYIDELFADDAGTVKVTRRKPRWLAAVACVALMIFGSVALYNHRVSVEVGEKTYTNNNIQLNMAECSVLMIDVNPSISMQINDRGEVIKVYAENDDADALLDELEIRYDDYKVALEETVKVLEDNDYLSSINNSMLITVLNADEEKAEQLREDAVEYVSTLKVADDKTEVSILSQTMSHENDYTDLAVEFSVSVGRIQLLDKLCGNYEDLDIEDMIENNVQTFNRVFKYIGLPENVFCEGSPAGAIPEKYSEKLLLGELSADDILSFTEDVADCYDRMSEYYDFDGIASKVDSAYKSAVTLPDSFGRQFFLHAYKLIFPQNDSKREELKIPVELCAKLPKDFRDFLDFAYFNFSESEYNQRPVE